MIIVHLKILSVKKITSSLEVSVTTIDEFVRNNSLDKISLIKVDVEGFETEVISGAMDTLKNLKPDLFIEIYSGSNSNPDPEFTIHELCALGYKAFVLIDGKTVPFISHSDSYYNYYFTHN